MSDKNEPRNEKDRQLDQYRVNDRDKPMTTNQGVKVSEDEFSLKAGDRGPTLMEDFHFREKLTHFDHERIPERVVHARGYAAHGEFECYEPMKEFTRAGFLSEKGKKTPVFVRFSTVLGSRGSADTVRDVRGFATKFYTEEGNYDLVGNNMPVFFIQDAIKFPDIIHAGKPEPDTEIPQAATAHDTFWDFVANNQETAHQVMWLMSDRGIPRSFRMMEGFGINTFRFVNEEEEAFFVKFHWKPKLGVHSLVWEEAQEISGKDPDFHRRDLYESIETENYPEYELGVQIVPQDDEFRFPFDVLDATKLWPEELVPVKIIGKMTLNRNVDNVFAETEQVAFHPGNVVPGIDFTNDPLLQGRLFSYIDTQLIRLGGPNFHEIPINRPICPFFNNQRDGYHRQTINKGKVSYHKNSLWNNTPSPVPPSKGGYKHYEEKVEGRKIRARSDSFKDHFSQAKLFWNSLTPVEKQHTVNGFSFELGKVQSKSLRQQNVEMFAHVDYELARQIADNVGVERPRHVESSGVANSKAISQENTVKLPNTRRVAVLIADGFNSNVVLNVLESLAKQGIQAYIISEKLGPVTGNDGIQLEATKTFQTGPSVLFDAVYIVAGARASKQFAKDALNYVSEAYRHFKPIGATGEGISWLELMKIGNVPGVIVQKSDGREFTNRFIAAIARHRFWNRPI
ncbi:catalase [Aciduricibacillus chroicocephali]|uniref:Catalase n=1 Tax=Aciduricibacillus chroicocephali TaxID=3054939 RepID=A0ABY9KU36_9BACI|nr:catalase [Bacillaceae bacterium 44XB]